MPYIDEDAIATRGETGITEDFEISVRTLTGKTITLRCSPHTTGGEIKQMIQDKEGIPPDQQKLIFTGKVLSDDKTVQEIGLKQGSVVHLILRIKGGSESYNATEELHKDDEEDNPPMLFSRKSKRYQKYSLEEVQKHCSFDDCWIIIHNNVYDVTKYANYHPGGKHIMETFAGKDATEIFDNIGHSKATARIMNELCIGEVATCEKQNDNASKCPFQSSSSASSAVTDLFNNESEINCTGNFSTESQQEASLVLCEFKDYIRNIKFPCVGAKTALFSGAFVFRFFGEINSEQAVEASCKEFERFAKDHQMKIWDQNNHFAALVFAFKPNSTNNNSNIDAIHSHLRKMYKKYTNRDLDDKEEKLNRLMFENDGAGYFVPGLHGSEDHILRKFKWPVIVFNSLAQFERMQKRDCEKLSNVMARRQVTFQM